MHCLSFGHVEKQKNLTVSHQTTVWMDSLHTIIPLQNVSVSINHIVLVILEGVSQYPCHWAHACEV